MDGGMDTAAPLNEYQKSFCLLLCDRLDVRDYTSYSKSIFLLLLLET